MNENIQVLSMAKFGKNDEYSVRFEFDKRLFYLQNQGLTHHYYT